MLAKKKVEKFRSILTKWLEELSQEVESTVQEDKKTEDETYADWTDIATVETNKALQQKILDRELTLMSEIEGALKRIDDQTFGTCDRCGDEISESRLLARPTTKMCIDCMTEVEGRASKYMRV